MLNLGKISIISEQILNLEEWVSSLKPETTIFLILNLLIKTSLLIIKIIL